VTLSEATELIVAMTAELSEARRDIAAYRMLAQQLLHFAHDLQARERRSGDRYHRLLNETRDLRQERRAA